ncbi:MAG: bifunctional ornithine acetyltransferase/N-acetylglutamate synthase [Sphaerochaeta sp.]|jgi:glutamate N-acetyltransferase/amino-acid N-acetyltransferase|nr:bifunctional ornithine acetyltransferase/N-acetylglutamate synthase [Sphaerochaeta sp.]MCH3921151.1 bifunctional ornithine acetyltransferase/N-acetylglutamate synthase [Sphaerochaeta sp.]MCI2045286.1 bifunctional ornithine acetyltransferase/N-acetylglutamate synthase [Sphaerochaeta sp.]MCI2097765.1 bifunctional ornithine acetyltransferase/N-acetylglutamate synthase [Sphaerochaeta sp.]MCI2104910.1 bifunctional ornithine acetyltransferase/N-acetylglutamate synthase [Sphaerochaeta sp.]
MRIIEGSITTPKGFLANGIACGLKRHKKDLAVVLSTSPCVVAGAFTTNLVKAAPVLWDKQVVDSGEPVFAIVVNSGNANAYTGPQGLVDAGLMAESAALSLNKEKKLLPKMSGKNVLVCSTGVIGVPLPMDTVEKGIARCVKGVKRENGHDAAEAICTTDTHTKEIAVELVIQGKKVHISAMAKGSGMIHPNMATMLSFITTDANVKKEALQKLLGSTITETYNMVSVDGDTSTNDTVLVLANGQSQISELDPSSPDWPAFCEAFLYVHTYIAKEIVRDGEGASKFIEVHVTGAKDKETAKVLAKSVISSSLVKAAFFGSDANWGRILCAMGYSGASFDPSQVTLSFSSPKGEIQVVDHGKPITFDEYRAKTILLEKEVHVEASVGSGPGEATAWGCDLTYEYVRINGDYRS